MTRTSAYIRISAKYLHIALARDLDGDPKHVLGDMASFPWWVGGAAPAALRAPDQGLELAAHLLGQEFDGQPLYRIVPYQHGPRPLLGHRRLYHVSWPDDRATVLLVIDGGERVPAADLPAWVARQP